MTPRYKLRTLLILLAILPPLLWIGWGKYQAWKAERERRAHFQRMQTLSIPLIIGDEEELIYPIDVSDLEHGKGP